jgi:hypothetical protein
MKPRRALWKAPKRTCIGTVNLAHAASPSPPLEERAGERRLFPATPRSGSWRDVTFSLLCLALPLTGCISKSKADEQARAAFLAGRQQAIQEMRQSQAQGPTVTLVGAVRAPLIPWTMDLTLAKAIVAAGYYSNTDPTRIVIVREGREIPVDPKKLLAGEDIPLQPRDVIEIH